MDDWPEVLQIGTEQRDLADTAALMEALDAVLCVDTSVAHLAGAMGIPLFLMLQRRPDWRWGLHGTTTPWYPTAALIRQDETFSWEPVLKRAMTLLLALPKRTPSS